MEMTGEMLYRMWLDCSAMVAAAAEPGPGQGNPAASVGAVALDAGARISGGAPTYRPLAAAGGPPWEELTPEGQRVFRCLARKLEMLAE
jgi:hypothetical protein